MIKSTCVDSCCTRAHIYWLELVGCGTALSYALPDAIRIHGIAALNGVGFFIRLIVVMEAYTGRVLVSE